MPTVTFLHTAGVHVETFDRLMEDAAPHLQRQHVVRDAWLAEAREKGLYEDLKDRVTGFLTEAAQSSDIVLCSCSTLGPLADAATHLAGNVMRIDRPMMEKAVGLDGTILVALCLESTLQPTLDLIQTVASENQRPGKVEAIVCSEAWPLFESGDTIGFGKMIAARIRAHLKDMDQPSCIVLAQASMAAAEPELTGLDVPVLSSPRLAVEAIVARATP